MGGRGVGWCRLDVKHVDCVTASDRAGARHKPCQLRDPQPPRPACPPPPPPPHSVAGCCRLGGWAPTSSCSPGGSPTSTRWVGVAGCAEPQVERVVGSDEGPGWVRRGAGGGHIAALGAALDMPRSERLGRAPLKGKDRVSHHAVSACLACLPCSHPAPRLPHRPAAPQYLELLGVPRSQVVPYNASRVYCAGEAAAGGGGGRVGQREQPAVGRTARTRGGVPNHMQANPHACLTKGHHPSALPQTACWCPPPPLASPRPARRCSWCAPDWVCARCQR